MKAVPAWLADVKVRFSCETCRQKHPKAYAPVEIAGIRPPKTDDDDAIAELPGVTTRGLSTRSRKSWPMTSRRWNR